MNDESAIPPTVRLVRDFINTAEPQAAEESLATPRQLRDWFAERDLMPPNALVRPPDLTLARTIREGFRSVLAGHPPDTVGIEALNLVLSEVPVRLTFSGGGYHLASAIDTPTGRALAQVLDAVRQCAEDQTWTRLKVCARDTCRWAFYDASRNQARRWCSMAGCGNRVKMRRAYTARTSRRKQAATGGTDPAAPSP